MRTTQKRRPSPALMQKLPSRESKHWQVPGRARLPWKPRTTHARKKETEHKGEESVVYKLTGAGSALVETQFPGTGHEMVSVYHLDGDDLRMTHYCAAGNQPRVKLDRVQLQA